MNILEFIQKFPDEDACRLKIKEQRDQIGIVCHKCNCKEHFWLENKQCYECKHCHSRQSLRSGTVMQNSKLPFRYWFVTMHFIGKNIHNFKNSEDYSKIETPLSTKTIIHFWRGDVELITEAAQKGYQIVNSLHTDTYLDYSYEKSSLKHVYEFSPIPPKLDKQYEKNIIGIGVQMWTEWVPTYKDVEYRVFPRVAAAAEVAWAGAGKYDDFLTRLKTYSKTWIE